MPRATAWQARELIRAPAARGLTVLIRGDENGQDPPPSVTEPRLPVYSLRHRPRSRGGDARMSFDRLIMPIGEVMFTQRSVRKFRPDPIPAEDPRLLVEAAVKAPNGGNHQIGRFLLITDREKIRAFGRLYHEAWWAKR